MVVTSDHGEELFDHSSFEHGHSVYGEISRVPLIINHAGLPRETRVGQLVRHIDVMPTLLGLMDVPIPPGLMGRDLRPAIADPNLDWQLPGFTETMLYGPPQFSLEQGQYKMNRIDPGQGRRQQRFAERRLGRHNIDRSVFELYDLARDPGEHRPLGPDHPEYASFVSLLGTARAAGAAFRIGAASEEIDEETLEQLRSLGYVR